jgi:5-methyltetrahydrofolate--homocysteine methyltransferase
MTANEISSRLSEFVNKYEMIRIIGGCCGTSPEHISQLRQMLDKKNQIKGESEVNLHLK